MATITTRVQGASPKGSPLTNAEVDNNFINLNTAKYESGDSISVADISSSGIVEISSSNDVGIRLNSTDYSSKISLSDSGGSSGVSNYNGQLRFFAGGDASTYTNQTHIATVSTGNIVLNEQGSDIDFRVESDNKTHMLFVDASTDRLGIGWDTPVHTVQVNNTSSNAAITDYTSSASLMFNSQSGSYTNGHFHNALGWARANSNGGTPGVLMAPVMDATGATKGFEIHVGAGNTSVQNRLSFASGETVLNEGSLDKDFRVESDTQTHALFVDAANSRVGINSDASDEGVALQVKGGAFQVKDHPYMPSWHIYQGAYSYWIKIYEREYQTANSFGHDGVILELVGSGSTAANTHYGRVVITHKQQQAEDGYTITIPEALGLQFAARYDETGGSNSTGELSLWVKASESYVSLSMWARQQFYNATVDSNISSGTIMMESTNSATTPTGALELEAISSMNGIYYDDGGTNNAVRGVNGYNQAYKTYASTLYVNGGAVINESSNDSDFRVESNTKTHALFVDASGDRLHVGGTTVPPSGTYSGVVEGKFGVAVAGLPVDPSATDILSSARFTVGGDGGNYLSMGTYTNATATGTAWIQSSYYVPSTAAYDLVLNPLGGNVGIGNVPNPGTTLHIKNTGSQTVLVERTTSDSSVGSELGRVVIGTGSGSYVAGMKSEIRTGQPGIDRVDLVFGVTTYTTSLQTMYERMRLKDAVEAVVNDISDDYDFRVESDTNTHALFVDAGNGTVNINYSNGSKPASAAGTQLQIGQNNAASQIFHDGTTADKGFISGTVTNDYVIYEGFSSGVWNERLRLNNGGEAVFNEGSLDRDFRVESDSHSNLFVCEAQSNGLVHIGKGAASFAATGCTFYPQGELNLTTGDNRVPLYLNREQSDGGIIAFYRTSNTFVGSISITSSGTTYNTTSDRRLKDNIEAITDGTAKIMAMNPVTHTWKADPEAPAVHGFIAQEMIEIVPEAISGDPEGEELMGMDYGRITPVLVAALQDAHKKIAELEARLNILEGK